MRVFHLVVSVFLMCSLLMLNGCKIQTLEEDRIARQKENGNFDAAEQAAQMWKDKIQPYLQQDAMELPALLEEIKQHDIAGAGSEFGHQAGLGSPWTFIVRGSASIIKVDKASRQGSALLDVNGHQVLLLTGPVIFSTGIRDALDFVSFDEFANQLDYADFGNALNTLSLQQNNPVLEKLEVGNEIQFTGVFSASANDAMIRITPVNVSVVSQ